MEKIKPTIGVVTYHAAYNFGSVLQAFATQKILDDLGYTNEIIDYRTPSQMKWYRTDVLTNSGPIAFLKTFGFIHLKNDRKKRRKKYEDFINNRLRLTAQTYSAFEEFTNPELDYEILLSGSDQIWNMTCGEFSHETSDAIRPYFLDFGHPRKKIAFASSIGTQSLNYVKGIKHFLVCYDILSTRETIGRRYLSKITDKQVVQVSDPTWLLDKEGWEIPGTYKPSTKNPYILVYTLNMWNRSIKGWFDVLKKIAKERGMEVISISPITFINDKRVHCLQDAGPLDILSYIRYAELVITNTFHGTIFSMNFEIPFYSIKTGLGSRQQQMLEICDLEMRMIESPVELTFLTDFFCDFSYSRERIKELRVKSIEFLKNALKD